VWGQAPVKKENYNIQREVSISNNQYPNKKFQYSISEEKVSIFNIQREVRIKNKIF